MTVGELELLAELITVIEHHTPLHVQEFQIITDSGKYVTVAWIGDHFEVKEID